MTLPDFLTQDSDGEIRVVGHRIGLYTLVRCYKEGYSAEKIDEEFPSLSLDLVRKVIVFYRANQTEVDAYVEEYRAELERQAASPPGPGVLKIRQLMDQLRQAETRHRSDPCWSDLPVLEKLRRIENGNGTGRPNPAEILAGIASLPLEPDGQEFSGRDHDKILYGE
jgi:uncharacterized protein (DUF433 family)